MRVLIDRIVKNAVGENGLQVGAEILRLAQVAAASHMGRRTAMQSEMRRETSPKHAGVRPRPFVVVRRGDAS